MTNLPAGEDDRQVLATDLDGTLIPLAGSAANESDLCTLAEELARNEITLVYVTGRHFQSVAGAIEQNQLPQPDWVICDVGTSIYQRRSGGGFELLEHFQSHQDQIIAELPIHALRDSLQSIGGLRLQEPEKQGRFKLSFYADASRLAELVERIQQRLDETGAPYSITSSIDPFNGDGLIDLLPAAASKAYALAWWAEHRGSSTDMIVFAGDSGNDLAALTCGYRSIVVANADRRLAQQAYDAHRQSGWTNRLHLARNPATSGVLEGCRWFGLAASNHEPGPTQRLGATPLNHETTHFRVWAPRRRTVSVQLQTAGTTTRHALKRQEWGYFEGSVQRAAPGTQYQFVLDDAQSRPDPASRYQPNGVHGSSQVINPDLFPWTDQAWRGVPKQELIIYEMHVGAFTQGGTFRSAIERLPELAELGVTAVEIMPVAQSPGRWNWGYDGVGLFAVRNTYGDPDDFKAFVDACHAGGLAVLLDVVYNHLGPEGNYLADFGPYFSRKHRTPWGEAFNFDERHAQHVRQFVIDNAIYWLDEYHLDGLRLDAVHFMLDESRPNILAEVRRSVAHYAATCNRNVHLIAEANVYDPELLAQEEGRTAYDAIWCDCLMHSIYAQGVRDLQLSHRKYDGGGELAEALGDGYLYVFQDRKPQRVTAEQRAILRKEEDGRIPIGSFVTALQTHDGVGNHPHGKRIHHLTSRAFQRSAAALTLLYPSIPLIFMGEEFSSDAKFPFFADFEDIALRRAVDHGRAREYPQHAWRDALPPSDPRAFYEAKCHDPGQGDAETFAWYRKLIEFRKSGIAAGWLSAANMSAAFDSARDLFSLRYTIDRDLAIVVLARLSAGDRQEADPVSVPLEGDLIFTSISASDATGANILLQPNHAVVIAGAGFARSKGPET